MAVGIGTTQFAGNRGAGGGFGAGAALTERRRRLEIMRSELANERSSFESHWRDLNDFILPRRARFFTSDANRGDRRNQKIIDTTSSLASRTLRSGMMAGLTSPARPWFRLTTTNPGLSELGAVKEWLHSVTQRMQTVFLRSNVYNSLPILYGDMGTFGTAAMLVEEDFDETIRTQMFPIGSYYVSNDARGRVRVFFREFRMTIRQLIDAFDEPIEREFFLDEPGRRRRRMTSREIDWSKFSGFVRNQYEQGNFETWVDVCHAIFPNQEHDPRRIESRFKKFRSVYFERGTSSAQKSRHLRPEDDERYLRDSGFDMFPVLVPRWELTGEDVYGTDCPGMTALGDIKQLMTGEKRVLQAAEKKVNPPMTGPTSLRRAKASILPGDITYVDVREGQQGFRPAHEVLLSINEMELKQQQVRTRISRAYFEDLFLMLATSTRRQITAREIEERHEEKLLALGPVLEQLNKDLLDPLIDLTFDIMFRQGSIPEPPEELQGTELKVEYISIMAQAQKLVGLAGIERFTGFANSVVGVVPQTLDKIDTDQLIDEYADITGVPPTIVRSDEEVEEIRQVRAQQAQAQAVAQAAQQAAATAKDLSQAKLGEENALTALTEQAQAGQIAPQ